MARRKTTRLAFDALMVEGALIAPDMIADIAAVKATAQFDADYRIPPGLKLRDEIGRSWRIAEALWGRFSQARAGGSVYAATQGFVDDLLRQVFGFASLETVAAREVGGRVFPVRRVALGGRVPIAIAAAGEGLDRGLDQFADEHRRRSASLLVQELLNVDDAALWGIATDGLKLRLVRDNASLTRPAYIEADLERMFGGGLYADFVALWLLIHESRFGAAEAAPSGCPLERWREAGREAGAKARERLGVGVEAALKELGAGFVEHPANGALRTAIEGGTLTPQALYEELLRLVYRLIFLFTTEDRGLLHDPKAGEAAKALYADGYSAARLRTQAARRAARDANHDLYEGLKVVFRALWRGEMALGLPALGGLFRGSALPNLGDAKVSNKRLLEAVFRLAWITEAHSLMRVNWRDMETEELGSVYEALLELTPRVDLEARSFFFAEGAETKGNARKISGSYYTPDSLVQLLLDSALDPVIERTVNENPGRAVEALLELTIIDPACGSGHFLLAAGRRLATRVAQLRSPGAPSAEDWRHALREVARHCLFGVDRNPMAVELCQTALWIESVDPGKPLTFLDAHIQCGDSLIGVWDLAALAEGIPDGAYKPLTGDDKAVASAVRKVNKAQRERPAQHNLFASGAADISNRARALEGLPEDDLHEVEAKAGAFEALREGASWWNTKVACDLYVAAFFRPKVKRQGALAASNQADDVPATSDVWAALAGHPPQGRLTASAIDVAEDIHAFHWPLAFPQVLAKDGFDVVLGNPPWDTMSPDAKEFFSPYDGSVRFMSPDDQKRRFEELKALPDAQKAWDAYCRHLYCAANFMKESGRYRLFAEGNLGKGDFNIYRMFVELALRGTRNQGRAAQFVPENLYNGANAAAIRRHLFENTNLTGLVAFENTRRIWFDIDTRQKFCLYIARPGGTTDSFGAAFGINSAEKLAALASGLPINLPVSLIEEFSPEALAIAEVAHPADIEVSRKIYTRFPKFGSSVPGLARREYMRELDMGNDREDFGHDPNGLPLYEGRMVDAFDHRAKAYVSGRGRSSVWADLAFDNAAKSIKPQWWVHEDALPDKVLNRFNHVRIGFCDVASPTNQRALVACLIPLNVVCGDKVPTITFDPPNSNLSLLWLGVANSFSMDFIVRKKVALKMSYTLLDSLPLPRTYSGSRTECAIASRALRLAATGLEMKLFWENAAATLGGDTEDFEPTEDLHVRTKLRAEIDVLVARDLFVLTRDEMRYVLDPGDILGRDCGFETFGALMRAEVRAHKAFITRDLILTTWDRLPSTISSPNLATSTPAASLVAHHAIGHIPNRAWTRHDQGSS